jgi:hypothetical protein
MPTNPEPPPLSAGTVSRKTLSRAERQRNVANMLGTLRVEKLTPSESLMPSLTAYIDGQKKRLIWWRKSRPNIAFRNADDVY